MSVRYLAEACVVAAGLMMFFFIVYMAGYLGLFW
jgi:hypothetical protein